MWDRSTNEYIQVVDGPDWQWQKGFANTAPDYLVRIRDGLLISTPVPAAGNTWAFEYTTWNAILDTDGSTKKQYFTADTDTFLLPEPVIAMGLRWRWKKEKGFEYAEDFRTYETMVEDALSREGVRKVLFADRTERESSPRIVVNQGDWPL